MALRHKELRRVIRINAPQVARTATACGLAALPPSGAQKGTSATETKGAPQAQKLLPALTCSPAAHMFGAATRHCRPAWYTPACSIAAQRTVEDRPTQRKTASTAHYERTIFCARNVLPRTRASCGTCAEGQLSNGGARKRTSCCRRRNLPARYTQLPAALQRIQHVWYCDERLLCSRAVEKKLLHR